MMKTYRKILAILLTLACLAAYALLPVSAEPADTNGFFADLETWDGTSGQGKPAQGGTFRIFGDGGYSLGTTADGGKYIRRSSAASTYIPLTLEQLPGKTHVVSVDFMYEALGETEKASDPAVTLIQLIGNATSGSTGESAKDWFNVMNAASDGSLYAYSGSNRSSAQKEIIYTMQAGEWYTVALYLDMQSGNYLVSVNGEVLPVLLNVFASATATADASVADVNEFRIGEAKAAVNGTVHTYGLDNIRIQSGDVTELTDSRIHTLPGASARVKAESGLRFHTEVENSFYEEFAEAFGAENIRFGTVIAPNAYAQAAGGARMHQLDALGHPVNYLNIPVSAWYAEGSGSNTFVGSVTDILENHYTLEYCAVGYCEVHIGGTAYRFYSSVVSVHHVREIAGMAVADRSEEPADGYAHYIDDGHANGAYSPYTTEQMAILKQFLAD